ncbi:MAG: CinA family nicotinamide mononucleotide deamidase-related protein [Phycisphaerales bacterium]|nr:CinA family nicotinamide mononucleotide deamidase-related protein [Phycisphaerales bacterium]
MGVTAAILSIGDELTLGQVGERNAQWIAQELLSLGVTVVEHRTVADDRAAIARAFRELACGRFVVVSTGGLGPTDDDLTRESLADALGDTALVEDPEARCAIEARFAKRVHPMPAINLRQALRPRTARTLLNAHGTAPGLAATLGGTLIYCLPGPPSEMSPMVSKQVLADITARLPQALRGGVCSRTIHSCGLSEALAAQRLGGLMDRGCNPLVGTTAQSAVVSARVRGWDEHAHDGSVERVITEIQRAWHPYVFGEGSTTLSQSLGDALVGRGERIALAESCTGGGVGEFLTSSPGASKWCVGGWIVYSNWLKESALGVSEELLVRDGAVSESVACAMALGAADRAGVRYGLSTTGIAGPDGGSPEKPVGTVWIGIADMGSGRDPAVRARRFHFPQDRAGIRVATQRIAVQWARLFVGGIADVPLLWEVGGPPKA